MLPPEIPAVSILLPVFNARDTLDAALASIVRQRDPDWECVAVDDGSEDASRERLAEWARRDPRVKVIACPHRGIVATLNAGLERCRAPLVARMDADDVMHPNRLASQRRALSSHSELAGVGSHVRLFPRRRLSPNRLVYEAWLNGLSSADDVARDAFIECPLAHPTWMLRREVVASSPYRDEGWPEDYDLVLRLLGEGHRLGVVTERLLFWRDGPGRLSRTGRAYALDRFVACKAHHLARSFLRDAEDYVLWGYGDTGRTLARSLRALGKRPSRIVEVHPGRLGQRIGGAPVVAPDDLAGGLGGKLIVSVAGEAPRAQVRAKTAELGLVEGRDFVCSA